MRKSRSLARRRAGSLALTVSTLAALAACGPAGDAALTPAPSATPDAERPVVASQLPAAPALPDAAPRERPCTEERCESGRLPTSIDALPGQPELQTAVARTGKRTRGSNSQLVIPQGIQLADVDADGYSDFIQTAGARLFVTKTDFNKTGVLHLYQERPIKRVLTGDFGGSGYDQTCVILDNNALKCYGISTDRKALWWWFTQGSVISDSEDAIVGDFDADGRDDILVYPRSGGAYRMYSVKGGAFFNATPSFAPGNLNTAVAGLQLRAGDFNGDGRDDLMVVNSAGQVISYTAVFDGTNHTFWWGFTTNGGMVGSNDQVTVARIDNNATDDVVLRNKSTGATRFHRLSYASGVLPALTGVAQGQLNVQANSQVFWGFMHGALSEAGGYYRDDAMVYDTVNNIFIRSDARYDGTNLTYWWAYTQWAPNLHLGWGAFTSRPFLVLKCKFNDISTTPQTNQFYHDVFQTDLGDYWREISYGTWEVGTSNVLDTWYTMAISNAAWSAGTVSRWDRAGYCINAYGGSTAGYVNTITLVNGEGDAGNQGGRVLATPSSSNVTFLAHETGHTFNYEHSWDDTTRQAASWSGPGEYFDNYDIMSAMNVFGFTNGHGVTSGPEMNAPYKAKGGFIPAPRQTKLVPAAAVQSATLSVAAINHPEGNGNLLVRVGNDDTNYYTVELRDKSGYDQAIPQSAVLVHRVVNGRSYLITASGGPARLAGSVASFPLGTRTFTLTVNSIATVGYTASVRIDY